MEKFGNIKPSVLTDMILAFVLPNESPPYLFSEISLRKLRPIVQVLIIQIEVNDLRDLANAKVADKQFLSGEFAINLPEAW